MYGLVNSAIHELVVSQLGEEGWTALCRRAGVRQTKFISLQSYPDELTYSLVGEVSRALNMPAAEVLRLFGQYWVKFTGRQGHRDVFEMFPKGKDGFIAFLENLDDMHARILMAMPDLRPPQIYCEVEPGGGLVVHYVSEREGLAPMVTGLLEGLFEYFEVRGKVTHRPADPSRAGSHDEFLVVFAG